MAVAVYEAFIYNGWFAVTSSESVHELHRSCGSWGSFSWNEWVSNLYKMVLND